MGRPYVVSNCNNKVTYENIVEKNSKDCICFRHRSTFLLFTLPLSNLHRSIPSGSPQRLLQYLIHAVSDRQCAAALQSSEVAVADMRLWPLFQLKCKPKGARFNLISNKKQGTHGTRLATTAQHHKQEALRRCLRGKSILPLQVSKCGTLVGISHLTCQIPPVRAAEGRGYSLMTREGIRSAVCGEGIALPGKGSQPRHVTGCDTGLGF